MAGPAALLLAPNDHQLRRGDSPRRLRVEREAPPAGRGASGKATVGETPAAIAAFALHVFLTFYGLGVGDLWRTENLRARVAAEMLESGDWVVPRLYGEPHFTKPPGMYAAVALASLPAGRVTEWSARLPSAVAAILTAALVYWSFRTSLGRAGGLVAALTLPVSFVWLDKAGAAEIDMLQTAWVAGSILFFLRAVEYHESDSPSAARPWWLAAMLCVAGGVLTKWTAPAFFYATAVPFLAWRRRLRLLLGRGHLCGAAVGMAICFAWATAAAGRAGLAPLAETVKREALIRLVPAAYGLPYPWLRSLTHPFVLLGVHLPWSALALWASRPAFGRLWDAKARRLWQALVCWVWPNMLVWSLVSDHASRHAFPLYPGLAGLAALAWFAWLTGRMSWRLPWATPAAALVMVLAVWIGVKVAFIHGVLPARNGDRRPHEKGAELAARVPAGQTLYACPMPDRDEGIMYYYGRPVRRVAGPEALPAGAGPVYCLLPESDWVRWRPPRPAAALWRVEGELRGVMVLVRVAGAQDLVRSF